MMLPYGWQPISKEEWDSWDDDQKRAYARTYIAKFAEFAEAIKPVMKIFVDSANQAVAALTEYMKNPVVKKFMRKAQRRERYNRKMSDRARKRA